MIDKILQTITPYHDQLDQHSLSQKLDSTKRIVTFMNCHVYSVWDFMNLLTTLQRECTCVTVPWQPKPSAKTARLINEIVLEEESDEIDGIATSHFEYYVSAIQKLDSNGEHLNLFLKDLKTAESVHDIVSKPYIPSPSRRFMTANAEVIDRSVIEVASVFAFGRETLVPILFEPIKQQLEVNDDPTFRQFASYLERHIQLDGEQHSNLALDMVEHLVQSESDWDLVETAAISALKSRIRFWDDIEAYIEAA